MTAINSRGQGDNDTPYPCIDSIERILQFGDHASADCAIGHVLPESITGDHRDE